MQFLWKKKAQYMSATNLKMSQSQWPSEVQVVSDTSFLKYLNQFENTVQVESCALFKKEKASITAQIDIIARNIQQHWLIHQKTF